MQELTPLPSKRRFPVGWCAVALLVFIAFVIFVFRNTIQVKYHKFVCDTAAGEFFRGITGNPPGLVARLIGPRHMDDMRKHSQAKLVEFGALQHRLYLFPRIEVSTAASQWLSHEFRTMQAKLGHRMSSSSGGTRDKTTGKPVRSIEIWLDSSEDVSQWDAWKASVDETEIEMMQLEEEE